MPLLLALGVLGFGMVFLGALWLARRRGVYVYVTVTVIAAALMNFAWFMNAGSDGPTTMMFLAAAMVFMAMYQSWGRWLMSGLLTADLILLYMLEAKYPGLVTPYATPALRRLDMVMTVPIAISMSVLMMQAVLAAHEAEHIRLARSRSSLESTLREVRTLKGLLPICSSCKKIRTDQGKWVQLERYISQNSEAEFSHGLCPTCLEVYLPKDSAKKI